MTETSSGSGLNIWALILVPSLLTLAVTILRLVGELQHWSPLLFNATAGGGAAVVGIAWLPIIFGRYFAMKLTGAGHGPASAARAIGFAVLGVAVFGLAGFIGFSAHTPSLPRHMTGLLLMVMGAALNYPAWPAFFKTLLAYAYAARLPVAIVMYFAIQGHWGTHYDAPPPDFKATGFWTTYIRTGLTPQLVDWVAYTILLGALVGTIFVAIARRAARLSPQSP